MYMAHRMETGSILLVVNAQPGSIFGAPTTLSYKARIANSLSFRHIAYDQDQVFGLGPKAILQFKISCNFWPKQELHLNTHVLFVVGTILNQTIKKYPKIASYQPVINGVAGNLVGVHASRLSTNLHQKKKSDALGQDRLVSFPRSVAPVHTNAKEILSSVNISTSYSTAWQ